VKAAPAAVVPPPVQPSPTDKGPTQRPATSNPPQATLSTGSAATGIDLNDKGNNEMTALIQALGDRTPGARQQAEQALRQRGERGIEALVGAIGDQNYDIQFGARSALARLGEPAVEPLIRALGDKKPKHYLVPMTAAEMLGKLGDAGAVTPLVRALRFGVNIDKAAAYALAEIGGVDLLVRSVEDMDDELTAQAVLGLRKWGDPRAADFIAKRCRETSNSGLLLFSGCALVDFGDARAVEPLMHVYKTRQGLGDAVAENLVRLGSAEVVGPLIYVLEESASAYNTRPRCEFAAQALGRLNDARAVQPLIVALGYEWSDIKAAAARALGRLKDASAIEPLIKVLDHQDSAVRSAAAWALAVCGDARGVERLLHDLNDDKYAFDAAASLVALGDARGREALILIVEKDGHEKRDQAVITLARLGNKHGLDELLKAFPRIMDKWQHDSEKLESVEILGDSGDERAVAPLVAYASKAESDEVLPTVFDALGRLGDPRGADALIRGLGSKHGGEVSAAALALNRLGDSRGADALIRGLSSCNHDVRSAAALALGRLRDVRAVEPLIVALGDIDGKVQASAARALAVLGDMRALEPLIRVLGEKRKWARLAAIDALGQLGDRAAIEPLRRMLGGDGDPDVSARAAEVLEKLPSGERAVDQATQQTPHDPNYVNAAVTAALGVLENAIGTAEKSRKPICDICGKHLAPADVKTIGAAPVVNATSKGYVPSKLPPTWKPQCEMLGVSVAFQWAAVVKMNSSVDWGLCQECLSEVEQFNPKAQTAAGGRGVGEVARQLWHILLVWSHPDRHDQDRLLSLMPLAVPDYSAQSKPPNGKIASVWITGLVDSYDLIGTATGAFGGDITDVNKYEIEERRFSRGQGSGRCLIVYRKLTSGSVDTLAPTSYMQVESPQQQNPRVPSPPAPQIRRASQNLRQGAIDQAEANGDKVSADKFRGEQFRAQAVWAMARGDAEGAEMALSQALANNADGWEEAYLLQARLRVMQRKTIQEVQESLDRAFELDSSPSIKNNAAQIMETYGETEEERRLAAEASQRMRQEATQTARENLEKAEVHLNQALGIDANHEETYLLQAALRVKQRRSLEEVQGAVDQALRLDSSPRTKNKAAGIIGTYGETAEEKRLATELSQRMRQKAIEQAEARGNRVYAEELRGEQFRAQAETAMARGDLEGAEMAVSQALANKANDVQAYLLQAELKVMQGRSMEEVQSSLDQAMRLDSRPSMKNNAARIMEAHETAEERRLAVAASQRTST